MNLNIEYDIMSINTIKKSILTEHVVKMINSQSDNSSPIKKDNPVKYNKSFSFIFNISSIFSTILQINKLKFMNAKYLLSDLIY